MNKSGIIMKTRNKKSRLHRLATLGIIPVLLLGGGLFWYLREKEPNAPDTTGPPLSEDINLEPATEQDQQRADQKKQDVVNNEGPKPSEDTKKSVTPVITRPTDSETISGDIEVRAFIPGIYEDTGECSAVFTNGSMSFTRQVEALKDATTTRCDTVQVAREDFPSTGNWSVKVTYSSPTAQGSSETRTFNVK